LKTIAVLLTCFNRKNKTLSALKHVYAAHKFNPFFELSIYLTDDGSTDGTGDAVKENFPEVTVLEGTGELYWAGGMRNSWAAAKQGEYDAYLLLNDDTNVYETVFDQLIATHNESIANYGGPGIYIGSTKDSETGDYTYGGAVFTNRFQFKYEFLHPNGKVQTCELGNANIMLVTKKVVDEIGMLSEGYRHGVADYDYTLKAVKKDIPNLIAPEYCGTCVHDHGNVYDAFPKKSLKERIQFLKHPLGLDFSSQLLFMKRHFPFRLPFVFLAGGLKTLFPKLYVKGRGKG